MLRSVQLLNFLIIYYISLGIAQSTDNQTCRTPDQKQGTCIDIKKCVPLITIMRKKPLTSADSNFVLRSQCGQYDHSPLVCCPLDHEESQPQPQHTQELQQLQQPHQAVLGPSIFSRFDADSLLPPPGVCGLQYDERIVGGEETGLKEFPWMALIKYDTQNGEEFNCAGSLIHKDFVLTACHCVSEYHLKHRGWTVLGVRLGEWDLSTDQDCEEDEIDDDIVLRCSDPVVDIPVAQIISHELYKPRQIYDKNDIAIMRLQRSVQFTDFIKPICLPILDEISNKNYDHVLMTVAGWGITENRTRSEVKLKVDVKGTSLNECYDKYGRISTKQLCAGGAKGKDSCQGDSGGPLMLKHRIDSRHEYNYLTGIVSFGPTPCGKKGWPAVYTVC